MMRKWWWMSPFPDAVWESVLGGDTGGLAKLEDDEDDAQSGDDLSPGHHDDTLSLSGRSVTDRSSLATEVWAGTVTGQGAGSRGWGIAASLQHPANCSAAVHHGQIFGFIWTKFKSIVLLMVLTFTVAMRQTQINPKLVVFEELQLASRLFFMEQLAVLSSRPTSRHQEDSMTST